MMLVMLRLLLACVFEVTHFLALKRPTTVFAAPSLCKDLFRNSHHTVDM